MRESQKTAPALLLGNGPSLANLNLREDTSGYATFGMNAAYRYWQEIGWWPEYYSCLDLVVGESHFGSIRQLINSDVAGIHAFLLRENVYARLNAAERECVECYEHLVAEGDLPQLSDITTGSHTLLWAQHLGYSTFLLAGVDLNYVERIEQAELIDGALEIVGSGGNPNYFFDAYQQTGDRYNIPNPIDDLHIDSWSRVAGYLRDDAVVVNLNPLSELEAFVRNVSDRPLQVGRLIPSYPPLLEKKLAGLNRYRFEGDEFLDDLKSEVKRIQAKNEWTRAIFENHAEGMMSLVFEHGTGFELVPTEIVDRNAAFVCDVADGWLIIQLADSVALLGRPPPTTRFLMHVKSAISGVAACLPARVKRVSLRENVMDIVSYYKSFRGLVILGLVGVISGLIVDPFDEPVRFAFLYASFVMLGPLLSRRN